VADVKTIQDWLLRLRPGDTPIFRHTRETLLALAQKGDSLTSREVAQPLLADPLATLRLIYGANNRTSRHIASEVATVEHALMMQGLQPFLEKVATLPVLESTPAAKDKVALATLYRQLRLAQHAAWQARDFSVLHADTRAEELQVTALLYYAPEFLFWLQAPETAQELARLRRRLPTAEAEEQVLGFRLASLRLAMLEAWKIPDANRDLLDDDYATRPRQTILRTCLDIAHRSRHGWWDAGLAEDYKTLAGLGSLTLDDVVATLHGNAVRVARAGSWVPAPPAATWLVMEPGEWPKEPDEEEEAPQAKPPIAASQAAPPPTAAEKTLPASPAKPAPAAMAPAPVPSQTGKPKLTPNPQIFKEAMAAIEEHLDGSLSLNQMSALILKGLHSGLALNRILFAMVTPDGQRVKCRFTLGIRADDPLRHFEFPIPQRGLFGRLMTKMQGVWINADNRAKLWPLVGPELQKVIGQGDFYAMSLFSGSKPMGLFYADRGHGEMGLDAETYADFKTLCLLAGRGLGKLKD
jgi:hypothetical protein